jgi:ABC-type transporter Mla subunit MlaD
MEQGKNKGREGNLRQILTRADTVLNQLKKDSEHHRDSYKSLNGKVDQLVSEQKRVDKKVDDLITSTSNHSQAADEKISALTQNVVTMADLQRRSHEELLEIVMAQSSSIQSLHESQKSQEGRIKALEKLITKGYSDQHQAIQTSTDAIITHQNTQGQTILDQIEEQGAGVRGHIDHKAACTNKLIRDVEGRQSSKLDLIHSGVGSLSLRIGRLNKHVSGLFDRMSGAVKKIGGFTKQFGEHVNGVTARLDTSMQQVEEINGTINGFNSDIKRTSVSLNNLSKNAGQWLTDMDTSTSSIRANAERMSVSASAMESSASTVKRSATDIRELSGQIDATFSKQERTLKSYGDSLVEKYADFIQQQQNIGRFTANLTIEALKKQQPEMIGEILDGLQNSIQPLVTSVRSLVTEVGAESNVQIAQSLEQVAKYAGMIKDAVISSGGHDASGLDELMIVVSNLEKDLNKISRAIEKVASQNQEIQLEVQELKALSDIEPDMDDSDDLRNLLPKGERSDQQGG